MCGIAALLAPIDKSFREELVGEMCELIAHRGPDGKGLYSAAVGAGPAGITLGHRRLSILDLSAAGAQPMRRGQLCISYNGEFYNYVEKRAALQAAGQHFHSESDTEVLLGLCAERGVLPALAEVNGMFAFALWDEAARCLWLARDRFGEKPLYYFFDGPRGCCIVASEPRAVLHAMRRLGHTVQARADVLACYLADADYEVGDATFFSEIKRVRPGELLRIDCAGHGDGKLGLTRQKYYELSPAHCPPVSGQDADERFVELLSESVRLRLRSDVPVGACLSGGLDSSSLVCLAAADLGVRGGELRTFSAIHEPGDACDERTYIDAVVRHTGVRSARVNPQELLSPESFLEFLRRHDEPVGGASVFAQHAVYRLIASQGVKVTLSGQGADECLTGYRGALPALHAELLRRRKWQALHQALKLAAPAAPLAALGSPLRLLLRGLVPQAAYKAWTRVRWQRQFRDGGLFCLSALGPAPVLPPPLPHARGFAERSVLHGYLYSLLCGSSLSTILRYEDRNSMAASVEARAPFLDHRVVEHCLGRPPEELVQNGLPKALLRRALGSRLPPIVAARRDKVGFAAPEARWLRGPLEPLVLDLLHSQTMRQRGLYDCDALLRMLRTTAAWPAGAMSPRSSEQSYDLWKALNTELWLREHALSL